MDGLCLNPGFHTISPAITAGGTKSMLAQRSPSSRFHFGYSLRSLWPGGADDEKRCDGLRSKDVESKVTKGEESESKWKWVFKILQMNSPPPSNEPVADEEGNARNVSGEADCCGDGECDVCSVDEDGDEEIEFDRESFSRMLRKVSLSDTKLCAQLSYLGNLAYSISKIKAGRLWKFHRLRFVTSSFEKRQVASKPGNYHRPSVNQEVEGDIENKSGLNEPQCSGHEGSVSAAFRVAASAAAYLQSHTKALLSLESFKHKSDEGSNCTGDSGQVDEMMNSDTASLRAAKGTMTAAVSAEEEARRDVADDLNSILSSPCEWFICDDEWCSTRFFVIQGSESLASWQANLVFEPTQFEGMDVLVHRGIYDAAKVMYAQMLPEVSAHVQAHGKYALFRFTGHSLGGSLSLLISLMLLIRGEVPSSGLLPVITYGSPSVMCGGDHLLHELGLPRSHVREIILHRDIVPRVFACHYPSRLSGLLKAVKGNFRNHPCLNNQELLYSPMGELLILQPDEILSPQHHLLPCGCGLYLLSCPWFPFRNCWKQLAAAERLFLNSPHPLEILGERAAYGSEGSIHRDHDMKSYLGSLRGVIRAEERSRRKDMRARIHEMWWYLALQVGIHVSIMLVRSVASLSMGQNGLVHFCVILPNWNEWLRRFRLFTCLCSC